jgi:hypothetical protein
MKHPIYDHRTIVGYATSPSNAKKQLKAMLQTIPNGWKLSVKERDTSIIDMPSGYVYSIHP